VRFLYETGGNRTFLGMLAGSLTSSGIHNTGLGTVALSNITTGESNTGVGSGALSNTADGSFNTASGVSALYFNTSGSANTASGWTALLNNVGDNNTAVGYLAGTNATTGANNIYLGANVVGVAGESNSIYVGVPGVQTKTTIAGIRGTVVAGAETVVIDAGGRLGSAPITGPGPNTVGTAQVIDNSLTADDLASDSVGTSELAADSVTAAKVAFNYAGSASEAGPALNSDLLDGFDSTVFARLTANTFTATQTIDGGNLDLDASTATSATSRRTAHGFSTTSAPARSTHSSARTPVISR